MNRILSDIWDGIRSQPGRTGLSFMAIGIGMISLTVLLAVLGGLRERSRLMIKEMGANVFAILPQRSDTLSGTNEIHESHATLIASNFPGCMVSGTRRFQAEIPGIEGTITLIACDEKLLDVRQWQLLTGRFIDTHDIKTFERNVVITKAISNTRGWEIGQVVSIKNEPFSIVGILAPGNDALETEGAGSSISMEEKSIFIPLSASKLWLDPNQGNYYNLDTIFIRVPETANLPGIMSSVQRVLTGPYEKADRFSWITPEVLLRGIRRLQAAIGFTVGSVALLCIILGGTTLMSLMVANVRDRITEIGLRRALGATPRDIAMLFVLEACLVTGTASIVGTTFCHLILFTAKQYLPSPIHLDGGTFLAPILLSIILGIIFSYGPAKMAAHISPSEALRND
ncbi:MAG: ABC transporter permease [Kiritimatiellae bacterium]|nr:ABC transporter permease [Kiritimatiellia bacterium]MDD5520726.1 ABC transporter permease [Kiritimatiellia bacterium]